MSDVTASYGTLLDLLLVFSYTIDDHSCLKRCIFTKFSQIVCLINTYILICRYARCNYKLWKVLWFDWVLWKLIDRYSSNIHEYCES